MKALAKHTAKRLAYHVAKHTAEPTAKRIAKREVKQMPSTAGEPRPDPSRPVPNRPEPIQTRDRENSFSHLGTAPFFPRCAVVARASAHARGAA